ncbi:hypothetical protein mvi_60740 (plasmid) [Methylobacterium indicum]|uniref:Uncharacterized protein n=1 Tax=Methylobacterium indicum TaxID=1775910 RepID=A0A8H8X0K6_9HYPH|nr:hypothetical protein mvi_60740 [Methylobacterium indicum]
MVDVEEGVTGVARLRRRKGLDAAGDHERVLKADEGQMQTSPPTDRAERSSRTSERGDAGQTIDLPCMDGEGLAPVLAGLAIHSLTI